VSFRVGEKMYSFDQYAALYRRPEIIREVLKGEDISQNIVRIEKETGVEVSKKTVTDIPPPEIFIRNLKAGDLLIMPKYYQVIEYPQISIFAEARDSTYGIEKVRILSNDNLAEEKQGKGDKRISIEVPLTLSGETLP